MFTKQKVTSALALALTALLTFAVAASATTYIWVQPTIYGTGDVQVNEDGTLTMVTDPGEVAGVYWDSTLTVGQILDMTGMTIAEFLVSPIWMQVQSQSSGPVPWEQNGAILDDWIGLWYGPEGFSPLADPSPVWLHNGLSDAWVIDPTNLPPDLEAFLAMEVTFVAEIQSTVVDGMVTHFINYCAGRRPPQDGDDNDGGIVVPVPDSVGNGGQSGEDVCFRFYLSPPGDGRIPMWDVLVAYYPAFAYTRTWEGSKATGPHGESLWELVEVNERWSYSPWNVGRDKLADGSVMPWVKGSWAAGEVQPAVIEFHGPVGPNGSVSDVVGTCLTLVIPGSISAISYPEKCYAGKSLEQLITSGVFQATYSQQGMIGWNAPLGRVVDLDNSVTWYAGQ
jgi:hypothetical protein